MSGGDMVRYCPPETPRERVQRLVHDIARKHGVEPADMMGRRRFRPLADARLELYATLRAQGMSLPHIGRIVGRDHTTVMDGIKSYRAREQTRNIALDSVCAMTHEGRAGKVLATPLPALNTTAIQGACDV